jgi:hypothetical protein
MKENQRNKYGENEGKDDEVFEPFAGDDANTFKGHGRKPYIIAEGPKQRNAAHGYGISEEMGNKANQKALQEQEGVDMPGIGDKFGEPEDDHKEEADAQE